MGFRKVSIKESVVDSIAEIAWFIESRGMVQTAEKFADEVYDLFVRLSDSRRTHAICRDPERAILGYKCLSYKKRYTVVFLETKDEITICELLPSKNINW